ADPHVGVCIGDAAPLAMKGDRITPLSFEKPDNYRYRGTDEQRYRRLNGGAGMTQASAVPGEGAPGRAARPAERIVTPGSQLEFLTRTSMDAQVSSDRINDLIARYNTKAEYPRGSYGQ